jgi:N-glycosidase YbiA
MNYQEFLNEINKSGTTTLKNTYSVNCSEGCTFEFISGDEISREGDTVNGKFGLKHRVVVKMGEASTESNYPVGTEFRINSDGSVQIPFYYDNDSRYLGGFYKGGKEISPVYHDILRIEKYVEKPANSSKGKKSKVKKVKVVKAEMPPIPDNFIAFNKVSEPYGWMSNMSKHPIDKEGKQWICAEALFQAMRFSNNTEIQQAISEQTNPMAVKFIAKKKTNIPLMSVKPASEEDYNNLKEVIGLKFSQNAALKDELLATGDKILFDNAFSRKDREPESIFWGGYIENGALVGENRLGKIWMELRAGLNN